MTASRVTVTCVVCGLPFQLDPAQQAGNRETMKQVCRKDFNDFLDIVRTNPDAFKAARAAVNRG